MSNPVNTGTLIGRLARDVNVFPNQDGSKKVVFTICADRNYRNAQNETPSDAISVEAFVRKDTDINRTPFAMIHRGDLVALEITLRMDNYTNRAGELVYDLKVIVENIKLLESKSVTQGRLAQRVAKAENANRVLQAQATVPPPGPGPVPAQAVPAQAVPAQAAPQPAMHGQLPFGN